MYLCYEHQHSSGPERRVNRGRSSLLSHIRHSRWFCHHRSALHSSTFLRSLRSTPVTELHCYYGRSDSCLLRLFGTWSMNSDSFSKQVSLIHASSLPDHSVSNHLTHPRSRFVTLPLSATGFPVLQGSGLRLSHAGSSTAPGRIEFVILRTGRSPPAALHPASRRRSCSWLQAGERLPEEDLHLSDHSRFSGARAVRLRLTGEPTLVTRLRRRLYFRHLILSTSTSSGSSSSGLLFQMRALENR